MAEIVLSKRGDAAELALSGRIDATNAQALEKKLLEVAEQFNTVKLDFAGVPYISSAGLRALKRLYKAMKSKNGSFTVKNVRKEVKDIFQVTGFIAILQTEE